MESEKKELEAKILAFLEVIKKEYNSPFLVERYENYFGIKKQITGSVIDRWYVLYYDRCTVPADMTMKEVFSKIEKEGICLYDSSLGASEPKVINLGGEKNSYLKDIKIIDVNTNKQ